MLYFWNNIEAISLKVEKNQFLSRDWCSSPLSATEGKSLLLSLEMQPSGSSPLMGKTFTHTLGGCAGSPHCENVGLAFSSTWLSITFIFRLYIARLTQQNMLCCWKKVWSALWFLLLDDSACKFHTRACTSLLLLRISSCTLCSPSWPHQPCLDPRV